MSLRLPVEIVNVSFLRLETTEDAKCVYVRENLRTRTLRSGYNVRNWDGDIAGRSPDLPRFLPHLSSMHAVCTDSLLASSLRPLSLLR